MKLMKNYSILDNFKDISRNIEYLEEEGKTVVILVVDKIP